MSLSFPSSPTLNQLYPSPPTSGVPVWRWDGSEWVVNVGTGAVVFAQFEYTAIGGQTTFSGADNNGATLAYTPKYIEVFVNGFMVNKGDITATDGVSVVLGLAVNAGDLITILAFSVNSVANTLAPSNNLSDVASASASRANLQVSKDASAAKAWVSFTGGASPVILAGYNVASVTQSSTGKYVITFTTPFSSANYAASVSNEGGTSGAWGGVFAGSRAAGSVTVDFLTISGGSVVFQDPGVGHAAFYGSQ